jgi:hypothetical protein
MNSGTAGIVTLKIAVDPTGTVQNVGVVSDVPSARKAQCEWAICTARVNGQAVARTARVKVVFNPFNPSGVGLPSPSLQARPA